ncbi:hypothetical protein GCM10023321_11880 [Pseudonocardia eucalypti]|uniref:Mce-associated membrane protein n=1 Tax=Pseudonocardia eucalypti TaxID=648755 RepID=A0ABP9PPP4_9PSEU|nr:Mce-associated membrane protein [Pseudonocardia eucalypti]
MDTGRTLARTIVASVVASVLLASAGGVLWYLRAQHDHRERDAAVTAAARNEVLALLTLSPDNPQATRDRVLAGATGAWREEFARGAGPFNQVVHTGQVGSRAAISASAVQHADQRRATVLVSANAVIQNADSPRGHPGAYRVRLVLENQDGNWLVSDLEFVA